MLHSILLHMDKIPMIPNIKDAIKSFLLPLGMGTGAIQDTLVTI